MGKRVRGSSDTEKAAEKVTAEGKLAADRIRRAMELAPGGPINQTELAARSGIGNSTLGWYLQGKRRLNVRAAKRLAARQVTDTHPAFLMGLIEEADMELLQAPPSVRASFLETLRAFAATTIPGLQDNPLAHSSLASRLAPRRPPLT